MAYTKSKELQEALNKAASSLHSKIQQVKVNKAPEQTQMNSDVNTKEKTNLSKLLLINSVVLGGLGFGVAHLTDGNKMLFTVLGVGLGVAASLVMAFVLNKNRATTSSSQSSSTDFTAYKREVTSRVREVNEEIRKSWENEMKSLTTNLRAEIEKSSWSEEQKKQAIDKTLIYKSLIISDYNYTDAIEDLEVNDNFSNNIDSLVNKWKESIVKIINSTKDEQWNEYFAHIYK